MALELPRNLRRLGGLWEVTSGRGHRYFRGGARGLRFYVFANGAAGPDDPPWLLYVDESNQAAPPMAPRQAVMTEDRPAPRRGARRTITNVSKRPRRAPATQPMSDDPLDDLFGGPGK